jgi:hypothetical protein
MAWATKSNSVVSLSPIHKFALDKSNTDLKQISDFNFKFVIPGPGSPVVFGPKYLIETPPSNYGSDESLSPYLLMLNAGMRKIGMNDSLEVAVEIAKKKTEVLKALKSEAVSSINLKDGTLIVSKGCLEVVRPTGSVMVNTPFSRKVASCG